MSARRLIRALRLAFTVAFVAVWVVALRPQALGGPAAWVLVSGESMQPRLSGGDLVLALRRSAYRRGDIVAFRVPDGDVGAGTVVIHRIVGGSARAGFVTRGDNRRDPDSWRPTPADIDGRLVTSIPFAGRLLALLRAPLVLAGLAAVAAFVLVPVPSGGGPEMAGRRQGRQRGRRRRDLEVVPERPVRDAAAAEQPD